jgi:hypothetical protein
MRGEQDSQVELLTTTSPGKRVPATHPIREIKRLADQCLAKLDPVFDASVRWVGMVIASSYEQLLYDDLDVLPPSTAVDVIEPVLGVVLDGEEIA